MFEIERRSKEGQFITIGYVEGYGTTTEPQEYSYVDNTVGTGIYHYRLKQIDFLGTYEYSDEIEVEVNGPLTFVLEQNYPNPFNPSTLIKYSVPENGFVKLSVYNLVGEEVNLLVSGQVDAGFYEIEFNATALPSGIYFYKLQAGNFIETKKMVLMK
ncbi:MAG: T9SS type A sorting domain-containing protein [Bacteroidetes bacterium]|nr:T9SS type A sorting domain-containing protein [Bacteroidota bacterium]